MSSLARFKFPIPTCNTFLLYSKVNWSSMCSLLPLHVFPAMSTSHPNPTLGQVQKKSWETSSLAQWLTCESTIKSMVISGLTVMLESCCRFLVLEAVPLDSPSEMVSGGLATAARADRVSACWQDICLLMGVSAPSCGLTSWPTVDRTSPVTRKSCRHPRPGTTLRCLLGMWNRNRRTPRLLFPSYSGVILVLFTAELPNAAS